VEYYHNILCFEAHWLINGITYQEKQQGMAPTGGVMTQNDYKNYKLDKRGRGYMEVVRKACRNTPALVSYDTIPQKFKDRIIDKIGGDPYKLTQKYGFKESVRPDAAAMEYYSNYKLPDGKNLPDKAIKEYTTNAAILNTIHSEVNKRAAKRKSMGGGNKSQLWESLAKEVEKLKHETGHTLPSNTRRLKEKLNLYLKDGFDSLVHKNFCNDNRRKVTEQLKQLFLALYSMPNKPYNTDVHDLYLQFMGGSLDIADPITGEMFEREDFYDKDGKPIMVSESTVWNYINDPMSRVFVDKVRTGSLEFQTKHRPHHQRHAPNFSLSKISMDDRDLPRKMTDGSRVKAYYSYDVLSGCIVGASFSKYKDTALFIDCMRDMFRNLNQWGLGIPMEAEVEHHLVNQFKNDLMQAEVVFPLVHWCVPGNSQEKYAEVLNKQKKYGYEKKYQQGIGRFYAKLEANRPKTDKISDKYNNNYKEKTYTYDKLVADDLETIELYNNDLHPNQKKYKGMTRMDVLLAYPNPDLVKHNPAKLARYIGESTLTSIDRSQYVRVQYGNYQLPTPTVLEKLAPNNYDVNAYYLPNDDGTIDEVFIYQNGNYLARCEKVEQYNRAKAEWTEKDKDAYTEQSKYVSRFDKLVKDNKPKKVAVIERSDLDEVVKVEAVQIEKPAPPTIEDDFEIDDDNEWLKNNAIDNL